MRTLLAVALVGAPLAIASAIWFNIQGRSPEMAPGEKAQSVSTDPPQEPKTQGPSAEAVALMQQLADLRAEVGALKRSAESASANGAVNAAPAADEHSAPLSPAEMERQKEQWHAHMADVETAFHRETLDPAWANTVSSTVKQAFTADEGLAGHLRDVTCRSRTCRLELEDNGPEPVSELIVPVLARLAETLPKAKSELITDPSGRRTTVVYMAKRPEG